MRRFTLVELMIVVAIIGILAGIAVPNFVAMQYKAKRAELPPNVDGIAAAQIAYDASYDVVFVTGFSMKPVATLQLDKTLRAWPTGTLFDTLGWSPDGDVRGTYAAVTGGSFNVCATVPATQWQGGAEGATDVDDDGVIAWYTCNCTQSTGFTGCGFYTNPDIY